MGLLSMAVKYIAQRRCGCFLPGIVESQAGQDFEQPDLLKDVPAHGRGVGLDDL